jgi:hypothetical protein
MSEFSFLTKNLGFMNSHILPQYKKMAKNSTPIPDPNVLILFLDWKNNKILI